jgi:hypothetical protein
MDRKNRNVDDFRRHRAWCPYGRPPGRRRLDLDTDHGAFPVWEWVTLPAAGGHSQRQVHGNAGPEYLGLSTGLAAALQSWANWQDQHQSTAWRGTQNPPPPTTEEDWRRWRDEGETLARRLADETGAEVVYRPDLADGCRQCQPHRDAEPRSPR